MAEMDLRELSPNDIVLHYGGRLSEVDAFTFSNSLIALGEAIQEINRQLRPDKKVEVAIESISPGSFRAKIKAVYKNVSSLFKDPGKDVLIGVLVWFICERGIKPNIGGESPMTVIVNDDSVIVQHGEDRIIVPRTVYDEAHKIKEPSKVRRQIAKTFSVIEGDESVTEFGLYADHKDDVPIALIPRAEFPHLSEFIEKDDESEDRRHEDIETQVVVVRAILENSNRQWQFAWTGIRISAPIVDKQFFADLSQRRYSFSQGDVLKVLLRIYQVKDAASGVFLNERYEILKVYGKKAPERQEGLF